jgi:hypothetical protein
MKKIISQIFFCLLCLVETQAQTLHLIMVSDYANPTFGKITLENEVNIEQVFKTVTSNLSYQLNKTYLNTGNKLFNRLGIINHLNKLTPNPEDIVVFYYNGFAAYPATSRSDFPTFTLNNTDNQKLSVDDVAAQLSLKNNRLSLVVADIRNTQNEVLNEIPGGVLTAGEQLSDIIIKKIFLEPTGVYKMVSAKKGMPSYPYFTKSFERAITGKSQITDTEMLREMSFEEVISSTQSKINTFIFYSKLKNPQLIQWSFTKLNKSVKSYQPPYFSIPTPAELKTQMERLANPVNANERANIEQTTRTFFTPNATLEVMTVRADNAQVINPPQKMTLEQYIKQTAGYDANAKRTIEFMVYDFKRTPDFKKFSELRIVEKIQ